MLDVNITEFKDPWAFVLLLLIPLVIYLRYRKKNWANIRFSSLRDLSAPASSWRIKFRPILTLVRLLCIVLIVVALARPREGNAQSKITRKGVVMELVVDRSSSMNEKMQYGSQVLSRFEVVKQVLADFIQGSDDLRGRDNDLIGMINFARYADTICPLVLSHDILTGFMKEMRTASQRWEDGTAIGDGIALAAARLKTAQDDIRQRNQALISSGNENKLNTDFEIQSKVIILLTDGIDNVSEKPPLEAAKLAKEWGIKIYTIGIGNPPRQQQPGLFIMGNRNQLDEVLLKDIADQTGGFYSRANDAQSLKQIIEKIDELEKSEIESIEYSLYTEKFMPFALAALVLLGLEALLGCSLFRKIP